LHDAGPDGSDFGLSENSFFEIASLTRNANKNTKSNSLTRMMAKLVA
jgi:hypothetical protein